MKTHILLVDSDKDELTFLMDALKLVSHDDGFKCSYASSGEQAIEILQHLVPDLIFVDFKLRGMNGLQFLSEISNQPSLQHTKKYLYSMFINELMSTAATEIGASGSVLKTFKITELSDELERIMSVTLEPSYVFSSIR
ncbi:MAG TPA: response regulator [Chitinophagaceae bacterium]|nr:response regulator [Chitinophagaceae bacterium]